MAELRIVVGASKDRSVDKVFDSVVAGAVKMRERIRKEATATGAGLSPPIAEGAKKVASVFDRMSNDVYKVRKKLGGKLAAPDIREFTGGYRDAARVVDTETRKIEAANARMAKSAASASAKWQAKYFSGVSPGRIGRGGLMGAGRSVFGLVGRGIGRARQLARDVAHDAGIETDPGAFAKSFIDRQAKASDIVHSGYIPGAAGPNGQRQDAATIQRETLNTATQYAQDPAKVLEGLQKFVAITGDLDTGRKIMGDMAKLTLATGSSMEDVVAAAGEISSKIGDIPDKANVVHAVMRQIAGAGKMGAVEMRDFASQLGKIAGYASRVGGDVDKNIGEMGLLMQLARQKGGAGSAAQAATSVGQFMETLATPAKLKKYREITGKSPYLDPGETRLASPESLIMEILAKTHGNQEKLHEVFGKSAARVTSGAANIYNTAGGGEKGLEAVKEYFDKLRQSTLSLADENQAAAEQMNTAQAKAQRFNDMLQQVADQSLTKFMDGLDRLPEGFADRLIEGVSGLAEAFVELTPRLGEMANSFLDLLGISRVGKPDVNLSTHTDKLQNILNAGEGTLTREEADAGKRDLVAAQKHLSDVERQYGKDQEDMKANGTLAKLLNPSAYHTQENKIENERKEAESQRAYIEAFTHALDAVMQKHRDNPQKVIVENKTPPQVHAPKGGTMQAEGTPATPRKN